MRAFFIFFVLCASLVGFANETSSLVLSLENADAQLLPLKKITNPAKAALIQQLFRNRLGALSSEQRASLEGVLAMLLEIENKGFSTEELDAAQQQLALFTVFSPLEIWEEARDLLSEERLRLAFSTPENGNMLLTRKQAELLQLFPFSPHLAENIDPPADDDDLEDPFAAPIDLPIISDADITDFNQLPLHDWEKQTIAHIVTTMAEKNVFQLLLEKKDMEKRGKRINHVHPLRFIGYVCSDLKLKRSLRLVRKNTFKWDGFIDGFAGRMREESGRNNLIRFLPGFAELVGVEPSDIMPYIQRLDCDGLVRFLIGN